MGSVVQGRIIRGPRDFWGGLALVGFALFVLWATSSLSGMQGFQFGPGTAPRLFALLLLALGIAVTLMGFKPGDAPERFHLRGSLFITASVVLFALAIRPFGLILTTFACYVIAAMASPTQSWPTSLLVGVGLTGFCCFLFPYVLDLPFQLQPYFLLK